MSAQSRSPSPKRKAQQQQSQQRIGGIGVLSSPKFSFRAALVQHKSKLAAKTGTASNDTSVVIQTDAKPTPQQSLLNSTSQDSKITRPIRSVATSSIPSLSARGRFNSTSSEAASTSTLPRRRNADPSPEPSRASSSLGKRPMDEAASIAALGDSSSISDFGPIMRSKGATCSMSAINKNASVASARGATKLPGPPSARSQWSGTASLKSVPSPSTSKAPRKIARSDSVAEVHAAIPNSSTVSPAETRIGSVRTRTISASARPIPSTQQRPKIGTLPKPKPRIVPVKTLLDERPSGLLGDDHGEGSESDDEEDDGDDDEDGLEGPDVSRIRTKRIVSQGSDVSTTQQSAAAQAKMLPPSFVTGSTGSRIPSIGSTGARTASRPHRRSSSNSVNLAASVGGEKENISQMPPGNAGNKRHSVGGAFGSQGRVRSSLPLAVTQPVPQEKQAESIREVSHSEQGFAQPPQPDPSTPASPTKSTTTTTTLSALRSRGLQSDSTKAAKMESLPSRSSRQDLGIKSSIISANPIHPSILALQAKTTQHQPISTPEALIKAKKRLSGALLSSSSSSSTLSAVGSTASPSERVSSLARSTSVNRFGSLKKTQSTPRSAVKQQEVGTGMTPATSAATLPRSGSRSPIKSSLLLFPTGPSEVAEEAKQQSKKEAMSPAVVRKLALSNARSTSNSARNRVLSSSEIDANLLASLRVVAQKANLKVRDLLDEEKQQRQRSESEQQEDMVETLSDLSPEDHRDAQQQRLRRQASEELEALAGDVSVDLMALDLAAGSPSSDVSMLRSPLLGNGEYLDTPPSVLTSMAPKDDDRTETTPQAGEVDDDATDTSCASPSVRAAALRLPRQHLSTTFGDNPAEGAETPVRRSYRNVPSIPSTPFPNPLASPSKSARAYPPSTGMSARTRTRLKKALRESLGIEAHFATLNLTTAANASASSNDVKLVDQKVEKASKEEAKNGGGGLRQSISAMLLTDDDAYLDELVSAVARIGLEDVLPEQSSTPTQPKHEVAASADQSTTHATNRSSDHSPSSTSDDPSALQAQLSSALSELSSLRTALLTSQTTTAQLESQLAIHLSSSTRTQRDHTLLHADLTTLKAELAGVHWDKAQTAWGRARVEALSDLEDVKVQADSMLVLRSQLEVWEGLVRQGCL
ncbi:uncharacterized protein UTRI_05685_B [Ustilago trichophora]|uniref:Uncharacterized protein n=1 Tax=Ustilago trichophora TaxID=86804 RepID=A0A5C3ES37_9BASI|nr:uncharacterized protein UTRI_05685_B [Ustilago trichophora]